MNTLKKFIYAIFIIFIIVCLYRNYLEYSIVKRQQLGTLEKRAYGEMIKEIDISQIPIVDKELALKQAGKKVEENITLNSCVKLGNPTIQNVNGKIFWVIPLEHKNIYKWWKNRTIPGYIKVSALNPDEVELVTELNGSKIQIQYQKSGKLENSIIRHVKNLKYGNTEVADYNFEIDNSGRPYYIVTIYGIEKVLVVDAQTGEFNEYLISDKNIPKWIDIVYSKKSIEKQIENYDFSNLFKSNKAKKTAFTSTIYIEGECYYFSGIYSDSTCIGFVMVNARNKKGYLSEIKGCAEKEAMQIAGKLFSDFNYKVTEPIPTNVSNMPTFIMALKDNEGLIKAYVLVNIENCFISGKGESLFLAENDYLQEILNKRTNYVTVEKNEYIYEGVVEKIISSVGENSTQYYIIFYGKEDKVFTAAYTVSNELPITKEGDKVKISYIDNKEVLINIINFDNITFEEQIIKKQNRNRSTEEEQARLIEEILKETQ